MQQKSYKWLTFGCSDHYMRERLLLKKEVRDAIWQKWRSQNPSEPLSVPQIIVACYLLMENNFAVSEFMAL